MSKKRARSVQHSSDVQWRLERIRRMNLERWKIDKSVQRPVTFNCSISLNSNNKNSDEVLTNWLWLKRQTWNCDQVWVKAWRACSFLIVSLSASTRSQETHYKTTSQKRFLEGMKHEAIVAGKKKHHWPEGLFCCRRRGFKILRYHTAVVARLLLFTRLRLDDPQGQLRTGFYHLYKRMCLALSHSRWD